MSWLPSKPAETRPEKKPAPPQEIRCPLCGKRVEPGEAQACSACAIAAKCGLVMCPNCSYEFAP